MKISTHWLKDFVTLAPPLERIAERLTLAGLEVKRIEPRPELKDTVFEVEITTNRPDWLSHFGVAREIHAVENTGLKFPSLEGPPDRFAPSGWKLDLKEAEGCPYYTACLLEGVQNGPTPDWMQNRLTACGLRSINLMVDITNYVLLELGQPLHAFDADLMRGREVIVRRAKSQETLAALDGKRYGLSSNDLVIADHDRAVALAGVMGGEETEVGGRTRNLLLESAFFDPRWVRKTSLRLGLSSESSYRFERRVDPEGVDWGRDRAVSLFRELAGVRRVSHVLKAGRKPTAEKSKIHLSLAEVEKILGVAMKPHQVHSILTRLGLEPKSENPETWVVTVPSYRSDLERPVDLVEEVARLSGYEKIPETLPERPPIEIRPNLLRDLEERTRDFLAGAGLYETVTSSLVSPVSFEHAGFELKDMVRIQNPIHEELTLMRPSFMASLAEVLAGNERAGERSVPIFEIANLYRRKSGAEAPEEEKSLGLLVSGERRFGWKGPHRNFDSHDLKGILEAYFEILGIKTLSFLPQPFSFLEGSARVSAGKETVGFLGVISPAVASEWDLRGPAAFAEISLARLVRHLPAERKFEALPRFPAVERDLSLVVEEGLQIGEIREEIKRLGKGLVRNVELFDLFRGGRIPKGQKGVAFRMIYQSLERTLLSEEVQRLHETVAGEISKKFGASFQNAK